MTTPFSRKPSGPVQLITSVRPRASAAISRLKSVRRLAGAVGDAITYSSLGRVGSLAVKAISPLGPTDTSTQKDELGLAPPVSSLRGAPPLNGWSQSATRRSSLAPTSSVVPSGIQTARAMLR